MALLHNETSTGVLSRVADVHGYFRVLAEASPRVRLRNIGTSEEGREILLAAIAHLVFMPSTTSQ